MVFADGSACDHGVCDEGWGEVALIDLLLADEVDAGGCWNPKVSVGIVVEGPYVVKADEF